MMMSAQPTILFKNCNIYENPDVKQIFVKDGKIISFNNSEGFDPDIVFDLQGGFVYPGFADAHLHLAGLGASLEQINLVGTTSPEEILTLLDNHLVDDDHWISGRGWDQNDWINNEFPTKEMLDSIVPNIPVFLRRIDGHAAWVNSKALEIAGITNETLSPKGGRILKNNRGNPTGIFIDNAIDLISSHIPKDDINDKKRQIIKSQDFLISLGITSVHEPGVSASVIEALKQLRDEKLMKIRVYAMLDDNPKVVNPFLQSGPEICNFLQFRSIKIYFDGALGSRGAALIEPYSDDGLNRGLFLTDPDSIRTKVAQFNAAGFQANIHCIGDRANREALDIFEINGTPELRNRIEHAQIIHPDDIPRFRRLGVIPSMQPTHCTSDMPWAELRLGPHRLKGAYAWQSLIQAGSMVPAGSDAPVEHPDPLAGIYAAISRQNKYGEPKSGWIPKERMTIKQAISAFTEWPAYASFQENSLGKIEAGFFADFTVLSQPIESLNSTEILSTDVLFTIVSGTIVYTKP
jgi:hypothetical protein